MKSRAVTIALALTILAISNAAETCTVVKNASYYLSLTTDQLYTEATKGKRVGKCYIAEATRGVCDLYVKSAIPGAAGDRGWPKTTGRRGTGCVKAPDLPKRVTTCFYSNSQYQLTSLERASFCTSRGKQNAVAQLKHAIRNNACALTTSVAPTSCAKGSPGCQCTGSPDTCTRPSPGSPWSISRVLLDRVRRCRNKRFFCNSVVTRHEYKVFDRSHAKRQQKKLYLSQVNVPLKSRTKNVVFAVSGQQQQKGVPLLPLLEDGQRSGITGQKNDYSGQFRRKTGSIFYAVSSNSLVNAILHTGLFSRSDTFVGLVFDARFNFEYRAKRKNKIEDAYFNYIIAKLGGYAETIYLAGHSRGGCLVMRLARRLALKYPKARIIVHNFDGVCTPRKAIMPWTKSEFGVRKEYVDNPLRKGFRVLTTDIAAQFPSRKCLAVRSFLSGDKVRISVARGFGHKSFKDRSNSLTTPSGFAWYTQSFHKEKHVSIDNYYHATAVKHLRKSLQNLPCECGAPQVRSRSSGGRTTAGPRISRSRSKVPLAPSRLMRQK